MLHKSIHKKSRKRLIGAVTGHILGEIVSKQRFITGFCEIVQGISRSPALAMQLNS